MNVVEDSFLGKLYFTQKMTRINIMLILYTFYFFIKFVSWKTYLH
jgi:hypothetical protein